MQGIEEHRRGIAARLVLDHFCSGTIAPDLQLLDGGGAKRVGSRQQDGLALGAEGMRQLADGGRLASAVDTDDENDLRLAINFLHRILLGGIEDGQQLFFQHALQLIDVLHLLAVHFFAQRFQHGRSGRGAKIGREQRGFQIVERIPINLLAESNNIFNSFAEALARARDRLFHALQKTGFFLGAAK